MGCPWSQSKCSGGQAASLEFSSNGSVSKTQVKDNAPHYLKSETDRAKDFHKLHIDPRVPLSNQQAFKLLQSWRGITRKMGEAGVEMFVQDWTTSQWILMGCQESKANRIRPHRRFDRTVTPEKVVTRSLWKEGVQCPVDDRQAFKIKQSWKGIRRNMEVTGIEMFMRLFRSNSELQAMFKGFKDIKTDSELRSNEALENHATLVMTTLDDAITHIDNYEYVKDLLYRTSSTHTKFTGFQPAYFMHVKEPFLEAVRVTLGDRYTDNMQNIYTIAITYVLQTLKEGMEEALK